MTERIDYSPRHQFRRALAMDWSLYGMDLVYGVLYVLVGFFLARQVGHSQVYDVIVPFLCAAGFMVYQTWRICAPSARRATAPYFFNLPQDRNIALSARLTFLFLGVTWLIGLVFVGCGFKLGGAGITACYRIHPEFVVLPFLAVAAPVCHVHSVHGWDYWGGAAVFFIGICSWFVWKLYAIDAHPPVADNNFWPERDMSVWIQLIVAGIIMGISWRLVARARVQWHKRQIGAIQ
jgi:hypothetical protein